MRTVLLILLFVVVLGAFVYSGTEEAAILPLRFELAAIYVCLLGGAGGTRLSVSTLGSKRKNKRGPVSLNGVFCFTRRVFLTNVCCYYLFAVVSVSVFF